MPELPEVEAARRAVEEHCTGLKIKKSIIADDVKVIDGVSSQDFEASILGKTIVAAHRKGKHMWIQLDSPPFPTFQFGMAGAVYIKGVAVTKYKRSAVNDEDEWPSRHSKFFIELENGLELSFTDMRRFARVRLLENPVAVPPISELGPDALLKPKTIEEFQKALSKKKIAIKTLLLDQSFISGIGNWIADEVLYQARIHPLQITSSMSKESCAALLKCINEVIEFSVDVDADSSRFPVEWLFHYRWGKKPGKVNGRKIEFLVAGGRTSAYVPELQKLSGPQPAKASKKQDKKPKGKDTTAAADEDKPAKTTAKRKSNKRIDDDDDDASSGGNDDENDSDTAQKPSKKKAASTRSRKQSKKAK
ncbi:PREDICTED: formamidopyrimidine-DNA glycosylase isoform X2 [Ipomoea nil]|uniref:formamidopyrimidine-DNA glycosylase isoform X2 n=1 Tax=Ipomoea nil TaxID=35883 RepID=UPI000900C4A0|nr:PREDICTED: formamidopyrimidine-DNA glycosylase isoform X2 [Ipomoea nil]